MSMTTSVYLLLLTIVSTSGHVIEENHANDENFRDVAEQRALKTDSVLMGIAKSLIGAKTEAASGQV